MLSLGHQKALFLEPADDLGSGRRRADALGFLQALPQHLIVNEPPGILRRLDQGAFVVTRRWPSLLVLDFWILQLRSLTVPQWWKQLRLVTLFVGRLPLRECRAPAEIDGLTAGGAWVAGLRYGEGMLYTKNAGDRRVYWQGPSLGFDFGGDGARTMMLIYDLPATDAIYQRFVGIEGSAYFVGGLGMTALTFNNIVVVPIRSGIGLRLGANVGYLKFTPTATWNPF